MGNRNPRIGAVLQGSWATAVQRNKIHTDHTSLGEIYQEDKIDRVPDISEDM